MTIGEMMDLVEKARTEFDCALKNNAGREELNSIIFRYINLCCSLFEEQVICENLKEVYEEYKKNTAA